MTSDDASFVALEAWYLTHFSPTSPEVSVLIPALDAGKTLRRAVESVQNQTLRNVEVIVVDAGSSDSTARMLDTFSERDIRVVTLHVDACSREEALNLALDRAHGEYLLVMDADGWLEGASLQQMVDAARERALDLVVAGLDVQVTSPRRSFELAAATEGVEYLTQQEFRSGAWQHFLSGQLAPASGKLFSREAVMGRGLRFDPESGSDHSFTISYLEDVERVAFVPATYRVARTVEGPCVGIDVADGLHERLEAGYDGIVDLLGHWGMAGDAASMKMLAGRYIEMLSVCVETASLAQGASAEGRELVGRMISSERARLAADVAAPRDTAAKALVTPIKTQNASMAVMQARLMSMLRRGIPSAVTPDAVL